MTDSSNRQIITKRILNASRISVFSAWTNPELLAQWWGPAGFTNTFHEFDPKPGGKWQFTMHGPNGGHYPNESVFIQITIPERIVLRHVSKPHFQLIAQFEEIDESKTLLIFQQLFDTAEEYNKVKTIAVDANEENIDRLERVIKQIKV